VGPSLSALPLARPSFASLPAKRGKPMRSCRRFLAGIPHLGVGHPRLTHPSATPCLLLRRRRRRTCDLHVLGTPPAFILSQDQTRHPMSIAHPLVTEGVAAPWSLSDPGQVCLSTWLVRRFSCPLGCAQETSLTGCCSYQQLLFVLLSTFQLSRYLFGVSL
jgi:hypothetical protein